MRKILIVLAASLWSVSNIFIAPPVMAQYNMMPTQQQGCTGTGTTGQTTQPAIPANPGPPQRLISAPQIPNMNGYQQTGTFISGSAFPQSNTGPIFSVFLVTTGDPAVLNQTFQSLMTGQGWQVTTTSGTGLVAGTMGLVTCNVTVLPAQGTTQTRIYVQYQTNNPPSNSPGNSGGGGGGGSGCGLGPTPNTQAGCQGCTTGLQYGCGGPVQSGGQGPTQYGGAGPTQTPAYNPQGASQQTPGAGAGPPNTGSGQYGSGQTGSYGSGQTGSYGSGQTGPNGSGQTGPNGGGPYGGGCGTGLGCGGGSMQNGGMAVPGLVPAQQSRQYQQQYQQQPQQQYRR